MLQADGRRDLEENRDSDSSDLYGATEGVVLADATLPASRQWNGIDSGLVVADITAPGDVIHFNVGETTPPGIGRGEVVAHLLIPDNDEDGITSDIDFGQHGKLTAISVEIDVTHSYIGDLEVSLQALASVKEEDSALAESFAEHVGGLVEVLQEVFGEVFEDEVPEDLSPLAEEGELAEAVAELVDGDFSEQETRDAAAEAAKSVRKMAMDFAKSRDGSKLEALGEFIEENIEAIAVF